jgi:hypothetical protein
LAKSKALLVEKANSVDIINVLNELDVPFKIKPFKYYYCFYFPELGEDNESMPGIMWGGKCLLKNAQKFYSKWLFERGRYQDALKSYKNNYSAYVRCETPNGVRVNGQIIPRTMFYPEIQKAVLFVNDVRFLGYSLRNKHIRPGKVIRLDYFWEVQGEPEYNLSVFVYFIKDGNIVFQQDHKFLYQFARPLNPLEGERFRETLKLNVPSNIPLGKYDIVFGLWNKATKKRVYIKDNAKKKISKKCIGEIIVE